MNKYNKEGSAKQVLSIRAIINDYLESLDGENKMEDFIYGHLDYIGGDDIDQWDHDDVTVDLPHDQVIIKHKFTYSTPEDDEPEEDGGLAQWSEYQTGRRVVEAGAREDSILEAITNPRNSLVVEFVDGLVNTFYNINHHSYDACGEKVILRIYTKNEGIKAFPSERVHSTSFQYSGNQGGMEG